MFGKKAAPVSPVSTDYGFTACQTCATTHKTSCSKIDNELAQKLAERGIGPKHPNFNVAFAAAKKAALGG
jgi:hypothetical protein